MPWCLSSPSAVCASPAIRESPTDRRCCAGTPYLPGILANAAATALVVAGLDGWPAVARALDLNKVLVVDESGMVYLTPEMEQRMQFSGDVELVIVEVSL